MNNFEDRDINDDDFDPDLDEFTDILGDDSVSIIRIRGNKKFLRWLKEVYKRNGIPLERDDEEILSNVESFHVPSFNEEDNIKDFFEEFGRDIFQYMFALHFRNTKFFPEYKNIESLRQWFHITIDEHIKSFEEVLDFLDEIDGKVI
jgi:hypothetical protein